MFSISELSLASWIESVSRRISGFGRAVQSPFSSAKSRCAGSSAAQTAGDDVSRSKAGMGSSGSVVIGDFTVRKVDFLSENDRSCKYFNENIPLRNRFAKEMAKCLPNYRPEMRRLNVGVFDKTES